MHCWNNSAVQSSGRAEENKHGKVWHDGLGDATDNTAALEHARRTILQRRPDEYGRGRVTIETAFNECKDVCDMFSMRADTDAEDSMLTLQCSLHLYHIEGLLAACISTATDVRGALQRRVMSTKGRISDEDWHAHVRPAFKRRTIEVGRSRS